MIHQAKNLYSYLIQFGKSLQSPFLLLVRLYWGWQFIQTGIGHITHLDKVTSYFTQLGIPFPAFMTPAISILELGGGVLLVLGLGSRLIALLLTCNMIVAFVTGDRAALLSVFSDPDKFYAASPYTFLFASLLVLIFGPGKFSLDTLLANWFGFNGNGSVSNSKPLQNFAGAGE